MNNPEHSTDPHAIQYEAVVARHGGRQWIVELSSREQRLHHFAVSCSGFLLAMQKLTRQCLLISYLHSFAKGGTNCYLPAPGTSATSRTRHNPGSWAVEAEAHTDKRLDMQNTIKLHLSQSRRTVDLGPFARLIRHAEDPVAISRKRAHKEK
jgi:hypothetical protein